MEQWSLNSKQMVKRGNYSAEVSRGVPSFPIGSVVTPPCLPCQLSLGKLGCQSGMVRQRFLLPAPHASAEEGRHSDRLTALGQSQQKLRSNAMWGKVVLRSPVPGAV